MVLFIISILALIVTLIRDRYAKRLLQEADKRFEEVEKMLSYPPSLSILTRLAEAKEFIVITADKDDTYYFDSKCKKETIKGFCPGIYSYFEETEDAIIEVNKLLSKE